MRTVSRETRSRPVGQRLLRRLGGLVGAVVVLVGARPAQADPLTPYVSYCFPQYDGDVTVGYGNSPETRGLNIYFTLCAADPASALAETHKIEICKAALGAVICPGTSDYVWYDDSTSPPSGTLPAVSDVCTTPVVSSKRFKKLVRAVDWHDPAWDDVALVVRVNGQAVHPMDQGACMVW